MEEEKIEWLELLKNEEYIWVVYLVIIGLSFYANKIERDYIYTNNQNSKKKYRDINIIVFSLVTMIALYFFYINYKAVTDLKESDSDEKKKIVYVELFGALFALGAALCFLYAVIKDVNIDTELAFG